MVPTFTWGLVLSYLALAISDVSFANFFCVCIFWVLNPGRLPDILGLSPCESPRPRQRKTLRSKSFSPQTETKTRVAKGFEHAGSIPMGLIDETDKGDANGKIYH
jgi:hypothetical protein